MFHRLLKPNIFRCYPNGLLPRNTNPEEKRTTPGVRRSASGAEPKLEYYRLAKQPGLVYRVHRRLTRRQS